MGEKPWIEFLWWRECPSWERALAELRDEAASLGLDPDAIQVRELATDEDAEREGFAGADLGPGKLIRHRQWGTRGTGAPPIPA